MSKNLFQDMVKVKHARREIEVHSIEVKESREAPRKIKDRPRSMLWFVAIISLVFFLFALSYLFSKATVTVNPKVQELVLDENLSASRDGSTEALSFDLVVISGEENKIVRATEEKDVSLKAEGVVVIYNAFSSASQLLSIDTRLEGSNGKIYKTKKQINVPGMAKDGIPGSVEVGIYASQADEGYNSAPLDFKIFGFKGTPKYSKFYARSKGAITGGLKGKLLIISDSQKASVINEMKTNLQIQLFKKATDQIPSGFILFKDAVFLDTDPNSIDFTSSKDNLLPIKLKGTLYGILFDEQKLSKKIALDSIENYDDSGVYLPNIRDLTFSLSSKNNNSFADVKNIEFNLSGPAKIVWRFDGDKLAGELLGKSKKDFNQILAQYSNVDSAESQLSPFWKMSFPNKIKNIKVIVNYPK